MRKTERMLRSRIVLWSVAPLVAVLTVTGLYPSGAATGSTIGGAVTLPAPTAVSGAPTTRVAANSTESELRFTSGANTLYGTFERPAGSLAPSVPGVLLIADRSQTDRNGNGTGGTPNTLKRLADILASNGIASFRYDKFGTGKTGTGTLSKHPDQVTYNVFIDAAAAAFTTLRTQRGIDPSRLGVIGHGDGSLIALSLAADPKRSSGMAWLGVLNPPGFRALEVLEGQLLASLFTQATSTSVAKDKLDDAAKQLETAIKQIRAGQLDKVKPSDSSLAVLFSAGNLKFLQTQDAIDPQLLARRLPKSLAVYSACGLRGGIFPCKTSEALRKLLSTGTGRVTAEIDDTEQTLSGLDPKTGQVARPTSAKLETGLVASVKSAFRL